ncbi:hypothetical protein [Brevundimonas sp.]|uniref:hypothetical protein n=1 Tax=Brevundimonas sp. TaxID=1871086 RepID=UPI002ABA33DA|nr:hypothetical protein [Brevundimonas sp.]MDZ4363133.1 hypothetical protein [Brevundimonas sp.]
MNDLEQKARDRIAALRQEIEVLEGYLRLSGQAKALLDGVGDAVMVASASPQDKSEAGDDSTQNELYPIDNDVPVPPRRTRITDNPKPAVVVEAVLDILRQNGHPMSRRALHTTLKLKGLEVRGADPVKALGTMLWRAEDKLVQLEGYGYWPKADEYLPAHYFGGRHADFE